MILAFFVGIGCGIAFTIVGMVCLSDWLEEREQKGGKQ